MEGGYAPVPSAADSIGRQWPFAVVELLPGKVLELAVVRTHRRDKARALVEGAGGRDLALRGWHSWLVDAGILGPDTALGDIVMEDTEDTVMARTVGDIGNHDPDPGEDRK